MAQAGGEQSVGVVRLGRVQFAELDPLAVERDEVPVFALVVLEFEDRFLFLIGIESLEEGIGGPGHFDGRVARVVARVAECEGSGEEQSNDEAFFHGNGR